MREPRELEEWEQEREAEAVLSNRICETCRSLRFINRYGRQLDFRSERADFPACVVHVIKWSLPWPPDPWQTSSTYNDPISLEGRPLDRWGCDRWQRKCSTGCDSRKMVGARCNCGALAGEAP